MNAHEKQQFLSHWESEQRSGILRYVAAAAIAWGTFVVVFSTLLLTLVEDGFSLAQIKPAFFSKKFLQDWAFALLGGVGYGLTMWFYFKRRYRKIKAETDETAGPDS
ncbi:MAG: hypothetical protein IPH12_21775 [Saprospirales bacterium]|nr:hypothetical protein [Saprospirales bacterium]MBK8920540.1 hypothetical protein [Saprospirales bacterium]